MNVLEYFDLLHPGPSWKAWRAFVAAVYGEPLDPQELAIFQAQTGRDQPRPGGYGEAAVIVGVQSGKSQVIGTLASFHALEGKRGTYSAMVAQDARSATRALMAYAREPFDDMPEFRQEVTRDSAELLELRNGCSLAVYPCRPAAVRGIRCELVAIDELAFFVATDGRPNDREMLKVARGRVAMTGGKVVSLSSPYAESGQLFDLHKKHWARDSAILIWQATAPEMNPLLTPEYIAKIIEEDSEGAENEIFGRFRAGLSTYIDSEVLESAIEQGIRERLPDFSQRFTYAGYIDAASGSGKDAFALGIAHLDGGRAVLDVSKTWRPPFSPSAVIKECAEIFKRYKIQTVHGDKYAPGFVAEMFQKHGIAYRFADLTTSETYLGALPYLNSGAFALLDLPDLKKEIRGLERRTGPTGRDRVDHRRGQHDDRACAALGALVSVASKLGKGDGRCTWGDEPKAPEAPPAPVHVLSVAEVEQRIAERRAAARRPLLEAA